MPEPLMLALPPVVGAVIGLFTNWLAIKMLFRPLAERRILGLRIPFTPGILPRERQRMARSLGDTVATDLLDESTVAARLRSPSFKLAVREAVASSARSLFESSPDGLGAGIDATMIATIRSASIHALSGIGSSEAFSTGLLSGAHAAFDTARPLQVAALVPPGTVKSVAAALSGEGMADRVSRSIADAVVDALGRSAEAGKTIASFVPADRLRDLAARSVVSAWPSFQSLVAGILADRAVVRSMERSGARLIRRALDRFNAVQRFFIGLGQYDRVIIDNMPATIQDFTGAVRDLLAEESTRSAVVARVGDAVEAAVSKPLSAFGFLSDPARNATARDDLAAILRGAASTLDPELFDQLAGSLTTAHTIGELIDANPGLAERLVPALTGWLAARLDANASTGGHGGAGEPGEPGAAPPLRRVVAAFASAFIRSFMATAGAEPLSMTLSVDQAELEALSTSVADGLVELAARESSGILRSLDVRTLVVDKIDSLDMIEVERMILRVVDKELGAITAFGGILGAIIGIFQSLFMFLR